MTLAAHDLNVVIGAHTILDHVSLDRDPGTVTALTGASGSGKTTLLNCLGLLSKPTSGTISIDDKEATAWSDRQRRRFWASKAAFIYQDYEIIEEETVLYNVTLTPPGIFRHRPRPTPTTTSILETVGLSGREGDSSAVLSGGEKQRVGIARALYKKASYIFADEPTASLDAANRDHIIRLLKDAAHQGACVIIATHDEYLVAQADSAVTLTKRTSFTRIP